MKKSIKVIDKPVEEVYVIRDIEMDQISLEKWSVECRKDIGAAWEEDEDEKIEGNEDSNSKDKGVKNNNGRILEIILKEKISNVKLSARAKVIETVAKMGGKIVKDIKIERAKGGKKNYLSDVIFFKAA